MPAAPKPSAARVATTHRDSAERSSSVRSSKQWLVAPVTADGNDNAALLVGRITRFATFMCVVIMIAKVGCYIKTESPIIKVSALDSLGDLSANCISTYAGLKMGQIDPVSYPLGQARFDLIGSTSFTALMSTMMALSCLENLWDLIGLVAWPEKSNAKAIRELWTNLFESKSGDSAGWQRFVQHFGEPVHPLGGGLTQTMFHEVVSAGQRASAGRACDVAGDGERRRPLGPFEALLFASGALDSPAQKYKELVLTVGLLGCCAVYKCSLWLFVLLYAVPRTGSSVLAALAADKRNDFFATSTIIAFKIGVYMLDQRGMITAFTALAAEKALSCALGAILTLNWLFLLMASASSLSAKSPSQEILDTLPSEEEIASFLPPGLSVESVVYHTSAKVTVEISVFVSDSRLSLSKVLERCDELKAFCEAQAGVERCLVQLMDKEEILAASAPRKAASQPLLIEMAAVA